MMNFLFELKNKLTVNFPLTTCQGVLKCNSFKMGNATMNATKIFVIMKKWTSTPGNVLNENFKNNNEKMFEKKTHFFESHPSLDISFVKRTHQIK